MTQTPGLGVKDAMLNAGMIHAVVAGSVSKLGDREPEGGDWFDDEEIHNGEEDGCLPGFAMFRALQEGFLKNLQDFDTVEPTNIPMLRSMAVAYFYQSNFTTCREALKKILTIEPYNLGDLLMLAECELALDGERTWKEVENFICIGRGSSISPENIIDWDEKLVKNGRFLGGLLLQYLAFRKHTDEYHVNDAEKDDHVRMTKTEDRHARLVKRKRFLHFSVGKIANRLARTKHVMWYHKNNKDVLVAIFDDLCSQFSEFPRDDDQVHVYAKALCYNCLSWCEMDERPSVAWAHVCEGRKIMEKYRGDRNLRLLQGDLYTNEAMGAYLSSKDIRHPPPDMDGIFDTSSENASKLAIDAYEKAVDYIGTPHETAIVRDKGKWAEKFLREAPQRQALKG